MNVDVVFIHFYHMLNPILPCLKALFRFIVYDIRLVSTVEKKVTT